MKNKSMIITYSNLRHLLKRAGAYSQVDEKCKKYLSEYFEQLGKRKVAKIQLPISNIEYSVNRVSEMTQLDVILMYQSRDQKLHFIEINQLIKSKKKRAAGYVTVKLDTSVFATLVKTLLNTNAEVLYMPFLWIKHHKNLGNLCLNWFSVLYMSGANIKQESFEFLIYDKAANEQFYFETAKEALQKFLLRRQLGKGLDGYAL